MLCLLNLVQWSGVQYLRTNLVQYRIVQWGNTQLRWRVYQCVGEGRGEGTIKGIVGIIHCRLIQLTADRISESELTDGIPKYISKLLKTDKIYS